MTAVQKVSTANKYLNQQSTRPTTVKVNTSPIRKAASPQKEEEKNPYL